MILTLLLACVSAWAPKDADGDGYTYADGDCDDTTPERSPKAAERCDGIDDDCDGVIDNGVDTTRYPDADADGYGDAAHPTSTCGPIDGLVVDGSDCDDADPAVSPAAAEACNGQDDDCDGTVDVNPTIDAQTWYTDADGDTWGGEAVSTCGPIAGVVGRGGDCDDSDPAVFPGAETPDEPGDGVDQDCDGSDACGDLDCDGWADLLLPYADRGDGSPGALAFGLLDRAALLQATIAAPAAPAVGAGDLDGDGDLDVAFAGGAADARVVWQVEAGLGASSRVDLPTNLAQDVIVADLNEDLVADLLFAESGPEGLPAAFSSIYLGGPAGIDADSPLKLPTYAARDVLLADLDANGRDDIVFCNGLARASEDEVSPIYWGEPGANYTTARNTSLTTTHCRLVQAGDVDGDGLKDLVFAQEGPAWLWVNDGDRFSAATATALPVSDVGHIAIGDLNGDGAADLVLAAALSEEELATAPASRFRDLATVVYQVDGAFVGEPLGAAGAVHPQVADLDGDGASDVIVPGYRGVDAAGDDTWSPGSTLLMGSPDGLVALAPLATENALWASVGDLDADGFPDLVFTGRYTPSGPPRGHVYWGSSAGFDDLNRTALPEGIGAAAPLLVGALP